MGKPQRSQGDCVGIQGGREETPALTVKVGKPFKEKVRGGTLGHQGPRDLCRQQCQGADGSQAGTQRVEMERLVRKLEYYYSYPFLLFTNNKCQFRVRFCARCCGDTDKLCPRGVQTGRETREIAR